MDVNSYIIYLKAQKRVPIKTVGLPNLDNGVSYVFDVFQAENKTFNIKIHDFYSLGRDDIATEPKHPEQIQFLSKFGVQCVEQDVLMFSNLSAFENFLVEILPIATNL